MKRFPLKFRQSVYQECNFYELSVVGRRAVAPGERISRIVVDTRFSSALFANANLTPVLAQTWAFYVPWRIVWDGWVDFIAEANGAPATVPITTVAAPAFLEGGGAGNRAALARRAYKLTYNQYFGDERSGATTGAGWYQDVDADAEVNPGWLLIWDQLRSSGRQGPYASRNYEAAVSGPVATIVLDDLSRAMRANRAHRRTQMSGDKYVDVMRTMGVELDWRVQMAPEFLGSSQQVVHPQENSSTDPTNMGVRVAGWSGQQQLMLKRPLAFAEHGIVLVLNAFRPLLGSKSSTPDTFMFNAQKFFRPDTVSGPFDELGTTDYERNFVYLKGQNVIGVDQNGYTFVDTDPTKLYVDPALFGTPLNNVNAMSQMVDVMFSGLTPARSGQA